MEPFFESNLFLWVVLPLLIFTARVLDVSIGTMRIMFVSRGMKAWSAILGFFEVLIWISVIGQVLQNLSNPFTYIAYAAGFATGNFVGILLEQKLSIGKIILRIITSQDITELSKYLKSKNLRFTQINGTGSEDNVSVLFTISERKHLPLLIKGINEYVPTAFYSIEDVRRVRDGEFPETIRNVTSEKPYSRKRIFSILKKK